MMSILNTFALLNVYILRRLLVEQEYIMSVGPAPHSHCGG